MSSVDFYRLTFRRAVNKLRPLGKLSLWELGFSDSILQDPLQRPLTRRQKAKMNEIITRAALIDQPPPLKGKRRGRRGGGGIGTSMRG